MKFFLVSLLVVALLPVGVYTFIRDGRKPISFIYWPLAIYGFIKELKNFQGKPWFLIPLIWLWVAIVSVFDVVIFFFWLLWQFGRIVKYFFMGVFDFIFRSKEDYISIKNNNTGKSILVYKEKARKRLGGFFSGPTMGQRKEEATEDDDVEDAIDEGETAEGPTF
jgi:hypothetical protein